MNVEKCASLKVADRVLAAFRKLVANVEGESLTVKSWSNGREQGYCISNSAGVDMKAWRMVVFAEARGSDDIIVIGGTWNDFDITTHQPNDATWEKERRVRWKDYKGAAKLVAEAIGIAKEKKAVMA